MTKHGIVLEPHSQNTVVVFENGPRPRATLVRDFEGTRILTNRFESCGYTDDFYPDSGVDASRAEMYEMIHALLVRQIGELVVALVREFDVDEKAWW